MIETTSAYGLTFLYPGFDTTIGRCLSWWGEFARLEVEFMLDTLRASEPGDLIDVGANIGAVSLPIAKAMPSSRVIGVEAHRGLAAIYAANALTNGLVNVDPIHAAAGSARAVLDFPTPPLSERGNFGSTGFGTRSDYLEPVRVLALDEIASPRTRLVKIDVEGFELEVLSGATRTLHEYRPVWVVEVSKERPEPSRRVIQTFLDAGYAAHLLMAPFVTMQPQKLGPKNAPITRGDFNLVAIPPAGPNVWDLQPMIAADDPYPTHSHEMPYLRRFGYREEDLEG